MRYLVLTAVLLLGGCGSRQWTKTSTALEITVAISMFVDHAQTQQITRDGFEGNPIMGTHGQRLAPEFYFPLAMVAHIVVAVALPKHARHAFQSLTIVGQGKAIAHNALEGYRGY